MIQPTFKLNDDIGGKHRGSHIIKPSNGGLKLGHCGGQHKAVLASQPIIVTKEVRVRPHPFELKSFNFTTKLVFYESPLLGTMSLLLER